MSNPDALVSPLTPDEAYAKAVNGDLIGPMELLSPEPYAEVPREAWKLSGLAPRTCWLRSLEIPADEEIEWFEYAGVRVDGSRLTRDGTRLVQQEDGTWLAVPVPGAYNLQLRLLAVGSLWAFQFKARPTVRDVPVQIHADALTERAAQEIAKQQLLAAASLDFGDVDTAEDTDETDRTPCPVCGSTDMVSSFDPEEAYAHAVRAGMIEPVVVESGSFDVPADTDSYSISGTADRNLWLRSLELPEGEEIEAFEAGGIIVWSGEHGPTRRAAGGTVWPGAQLSRDGSRLVVGQGAAFEYVPVPGAYNLWARFLPVGAVWRVHLRSRPIARTVTLRLHADTLNPYTQGQVEQMQLLQAALGWSEIR